MIKKNGYATDIIDLNIELFHEINDNKLWTMNSVFYWFSEENIETVFNKYRPYIKGIINKIKDLKPRILAFSLNSSNRLFSIYLVREIKKEIPNQFIICGGCGIKNEREINFIRDRADLFDIYVIGEGERKVIEIIKSVINSNKSDLEDIPDLYIRKNNDLFRTKSDKNYRVDIENLPILDIPEGIINNNYDKKEVMPVFFSRGCIGKCVFCNDSPRWKFYRTKSGKKMFNEIKYYYEKYNKSHFNFHDLLLNATLKQLIGFCDEIINAEMDIRWSGFFMIRKDISIQLCRKLKEAGCNYLNFGVDNFSDNVLKLMKKLYNIDDVINNLKILNKSGLFFTINYIVGFPGEEDEDFLKELDFLNKYHTYIPCFDSLGTLDVNEYSHIFNNLDEFNIEFPSGVMYGHNLWHTKDKKNTPEIRKLRLRKMVECCKENNIKINYVNNEY